MVVLGFSRRCVLGVWIIALLAMGMARGAAAQGPVTAEAPTEWQRLPDGRVVIEIYGRRLAFPPDMPPGQVVFQHGNRDVPLRDVIADRAGMERWWSGSGPTMPVGIALSMNLVRPLLFDGPAPLDRTALWLGPAFWVWVYQDPTRTECTRQEREIDRRACAFFLERARDEAAINAEGFIVEQPAMLRGLGSVFHLFPERERRAAPGDPARIACTEFPQAFFCENGSSIRWGTFIRPGLFMRYQYSMKKIHRQDMRRIDDAFRAVVDRFVLEDAAEGN